MMPIIIKQHRKQISIILLVIIIISIGVIFIISSISNQNSKDTTKAKSRLIVNILHFLTTISILVLLKHFFTP